MALHKVSWAEERNYGNSEIRSAGQGQGRGVGQGQGRGVGRAASIGRYHLVLSSGRIGAAPQGTMMAREIKDERG